MKTLKFLLFILLVTALVGCGNDDDDNWELSQESLRQTIWEGTHETKDYNENIIKTDSIVLEFSTVSTGRSLVIRNGEGTDTWEFTYNIQGRVINFNSWYLNAGYYIVEASKDKMVFMLLDYRKITITLHRKILR